MVKIISRTSLQLQKLAEARSKRWNTSEKSNSDGHVAVNPLRYVLATLSEGLSETTSRRFLAKLNIPPPSRDEFYKYQEKLHSIVENITEETLKEVREHLPKDSIFGIDCSWSGRRNAAHAIVIFMEMRTKLIFDKVIISREEAVSDIKFNGPSNLMENAAVKAKRDFYITNYRFIGFVHDYDVDTAPILHPDSITGQLVEFLDPGHLKKTLLNIYKSHNTKHELWQLKEHITNRFLSIVRDKTTSIEEKLRLWYATPDFIIESGYKTGYLVDNTKQKERTYDPKTARSYLLIFLHETAWLIEKCGYFDTQAIESWNSSCKNKLAPKGVAYHESFKTRTLMGILKWNDPDGWFDTLNDCFVGEELCGECKEVLEKDRAKQKRERSKAQQDEFRKIRNKQRRISRLKNRISPAGHQYADDNKEDKRLHDPTRQVSCTLLPHIDNLFSNNCFINSVLQLLRFTTPERNMKLACSGFVDIMYKLNQGMNINLEEIDSLRSTLPTSFSLKGQEDASEFYNWLMNDLHSKRRIIKCCSDPLIQKSLCRSPETNETKAFEEAYNFEMLEKHVCNSCSNTISEITTKEFCLQIPVVSGSFDINMYKALHEESVQIFCPHCHDIKECTVSRSMTKSTTFIMLQLLRFSYDAQSQSTTKIDKEVQIPRELDSKLFGKAYTLIGILYHIGSNANNGHYMVKHINHSGTIDTLDDSRCYCNPTEKNIIQKDAYMMLYQEKHDWKSNAPIISTLEKDIRSAYDICGKARVEIPSKKCKLPSKTHIRIKIPIVVSDRFVDLIRKKSHLFSLQIFDALHSPDKMNSREVRNILADVIEGVLRFQGIKNKEKVLTEFFTDLVDAHCISIPQYRFLESYIVAADRFPDETFQQILGQEIISTMNSLIAKTSNGGLNMVSHIKNMYVSSQHVRNNKYFSAFIENL